MTEILLVIVIVLLIINIFISTRKEEVNMGKISENIENKFDNMQKSFRKEFYTNREESRRNEQDNRQEIKVSIDSMTSSISRHIMNLSTLQQNQFDINSKNLEKLTKHFRMKVNVQLMTNMAKMV